MLSCGCALLPCVKEQRCETPLALWGGLRPWFNPSPAPLACGHRFQLSLVLHARLDVKQQDCSCREVQWNAAFQQLSEPGGKGLLILQRPCWLGLCHSGGNYSYCSVWVSIRARNGAHPGKTFATAATRCSARLRNSRRRSCTALNGESVQPRLGPSYLTATHRLHL